MVNSKGNLKEIITLSKKRIKLDNRREPTVSCCFIIKTLNYGLPFDIVLQRL